jgi:hypothetical protein
MIVAQVETRNFSFTAYGHTEREAKELLRKAWEKHQEQTEAWLTWDELQEDVFFLFVRFGDVFRDNDLFISGDTPPRNN